MPRIGRHDGRKLILTGERFTAAPLVDMGLIPLAVPRAELESSVQRQIDMIRLGGPIAVEECKRLVCRVPLRSREEGFAETTPCRGCVFASEEGQEGMAAFREKRQPLWGTHES